MVHTLAALVVFAHVGGVPTQARIVTPGALGDVADDTYVISWTDRNEDPTGLFDFYYQPTNVPPGSTLAALAGTPIPEAQDVPIMETTDQLAWSTTGVPPGSYFVYAVTQDDPPTPIFGISKVPLTVQHPGDPRHPAVVAVQPDGIGDTIAQTFAIRFEATGDGPLTARLSYGEQGTTNPTVVIVEDVPLTAGAAGVHTGCHTWQLASLPQGSYYVQVEVTDSGGRSHTAFSRGGIIVLRDGTAPAGTTCDDPLGDDGGVGGDGGSDALPGGGDDPGTCACRVGSRGARGERSALAPLAALLPLGLLACFRRRRRGR